MRSAIVAAFCTLTVAIATNSPTDVAKRLNALYSGFNPNDATSPLGVTISFRMKPDFETFCGNGCYKGFTDCRYSASLYNHKMILDNNTNAFKFAYDPSSAGIVFDQDLVESALGKCYYMYDGDSFVRFNNGCGSPARTRYGDCGNGSAYSNQCPSTHETCKVTDHEVADSNCENVAHPEDKLFLGCYWKGAAFDRNHVMASGDMLRTMATTRFGMDKRTDKPVHGGVELDLPNSRRPLVARKSVWNEVILDVTVMRKLLAKDPKAVVPAFLYMKGSSASLTQARALRKSFCSQFNVGQTDIPLIAVDTKVNVEEGHVFVAENNALTVEEVRNPPVDACAANGNVYQCHYNYECVWCDSAVGGNGQCHNFTHAATKEEKCDALVGCDAHRQQGLCDTDHKCKWCHTITQGWPSCQDISVDMNGSATCDRIAAKAPIVV